jgi:hypothetical protein
LFPSRGHVAWPKASRMIRVSDWAKPGHLKTRKSTGTSCGTGIHFCIQTTKFLSKYSLIFFRTFDRLISFFTKHFYQA